MGVHVPYEAEPRAPHGEDLRAKLRSRGIEWRDIPSKLPLAQRLARQRRSRLRRRLPPGLGRRSVERQFEHGLLKTCSCDRQPLLEFDDLNL